MKTLSRCRSNIEADNVVLIDVDTYDFNNVIVIDIPENHTKKKKGTRENSGPSKTYIFIGDDEIPCNKHADVSLDNERNFESGASSSRRYGSENTTPVKLSKGKRTYSRRGFNALSDSESSDDDSPDCEYMEDFSGKLREEWEKASLKRKGVVHNDNASCSRPYGDVDSEFGENRNKQKHAQGSNVNGTSDDKEGEPFNCHGRGVDGGKDDLPPGEIPSTSSEVENEKNDFENVATVDDDNEHENNDFENADSIFDEEFIDFENIAPIGDDNENEKNEFENTATIDDDDKGEKNAFEYTATIDDDDEGEKNDFENAAAIGDDIPVENSIIDQREKLKETDEYKRALEEELSARQKALQIQAEEAQQLRRLQKRKKAECLRLLDMERRQKQRVEEIRETQKKDEENMNLKEQYRTEVRQELKKLEITCFDMASLLRGLGIQVGNGFVPLSHEVRVAYKRALLSFHPDRASGSDMREQVEAEEKFKLISRMKEKFSFEVICKV